MPAFLPVLASATGDFLVSSATVKAVNNYLKKNPKNPISNSPIIPTSKQSIKPSRKVEQKENLQGLSDNLSTGLGLAALAVGTVAHNMATSSDSERFQKTAEKEALKQSFPDSPLLQNQITLAQSSDAIVDAINANSIVTATVFGTLDANLSAISASLIAISSTLIEISDNYKEEIEKAEDLPYIDSDTFYDLLEKSGMSHLQAYELKNEELAMVDNLSKGGHTYSEIKQAIQAFRNSVVPSDKLIKVGSSAAGVTSPSPIDVTTGEPISNTPFPDFEPLMAWATSAKVVSDYMGTPKSISDLDGNLVAETSPMEVQAIKNASDARHKTDINNETFDDTDNPLSSFDLMPLLNFVGRGDTFDVSKTLSNVFKPDGV